MLEALCLSVCSVLQVAECARWLSNGNLGYHSRFKGFWEDLPWGLSRFPVFSSLWTTPPVAMTVHHTDDAIYV